MQVSYLYIPSQVKSIPVETVKESSSLTILLKQNGQLLKVPSFRYTDDNVDLWCEKNGDSCIEYPKNKKLRIRIGKWGRITATPRASKPVIQIKDQLPNLFLKMAETLKPSPLVNLITGKQVDQSVSVEYLFEDEKVEISYKEENQPAWVYFVCPLVSPDIVATGETEGLKINFGKTEPNSAHVWNIDTLGWMKVPHDWSKVQLEAAFRSLAKDLIQQGTPAVQTWTAKVGTTVSLE